MDREGGMFGKVKRNGKIIVLLLLASLAGCDWFESQLEANLPPETELVECGTPQGITEGDDVRFGWRGSDVDGHVERFEISYDDNPWETTVAESTVISSVAQGDHAFRVRAVDNDGDVDPDPAQCLFTASAAGRFVDRVVLLEFFTTNECPNCPNSEAALKMLSDEMGAGAISIIAYHDRPSYSPDSDALATEQTDDRIAWYTGNPEFPGEDDTWPTVVFDGLRIVEAALTAEQVKILYTEEIAARAAIGSPLTLRLDGDIGSGEGGVSVVVKAETVPPAGSLVLRFVLIEDDVRYRGYYANRYDFVARLLFEDETLELAAAGDSVSVERDFMVDPSWVAENLDVIAFVQNTGTMEVIQSARLRPD